MGVEKPVQVLLMLVGVPVLAVMAPVLLRALLLHSGVHRNTVPALTTQMSFFLLLPAQEVLTGLTVLVGTGKCTRVSVQSELYEFKTHRCTHLFSTS